MSDFDNVENFIFFIFTNSIYKNFNKLKIFDNKKNIVLKIELKLYIINDII